jgi:hypothetical protein
VVKAVCSHSDVRSSRPFLEYLSRALRRIIKHYVLCAFDAEELARHYCQLNDNFRTWASSSCEDEYWECFYHFKKEIYATLKDMEQRDGEVWTAFLAVIDQNDVLRNELRHDQ